MQVKDFVKPELLIVAVVLYFIGICAIYVFATCTCITSQNIAQAIFTAITQGILVAGLSTYVNQLMKQTGKEE